MKEIEWDDVGAESDLLTLENTTRIRIVSSKPRSVDIHWVEIKGQNNRMVCPGEGCLVCRAGHGPTKRSIIPVFDRKTKTVKILEHGPSVFGQIKNLVQSNSYGDPRNYDITVTKTGTGRQTKYSVIPEPPVTLTTAEVEYIKNNCPKVSELEFYKGASIEEQKEMLKKMGVVLQSDSTPPNAPPASVVSTPPASNPTVSSPTTSFSVVNAPKLSDLDL